LPKLPETLQDSFFFLSSHRTNDENHLLRINIFGGFYADLISSP
jgi:hypothetical protein